MMTLKINTLQGEGLDFQLLRLPCPPHPAQYVGCRGPTGDQETLHLKSGSTSFLPGPTELLFLSQHF